MCASCGRENPEDARFCNGCGAPLEGLARAPQEVRKVVTVLFTDVAGSTALGERLDPESLRRVMSRYFSALTGVIERHGGTVEKFIGDAVMAVFGIPQAHEDDAVRAVRAAAEIRDSLAELNAELATRPDLAITTRTGINTGEVVAGDASSRQALVTGDTVNIAARLEQAAAPGEILIGEATHALVRDAVTVQRLEPLLLKGKAEAVRALRLLEVKPDAAGHERRLDSPMVGRDRQLGLLRDAFEAAVGDRACVLFTVLGPAGVGKSRLAEEFLDGVVDRATILRGRCLSYGDGITFWPMTEAITQAVGISQADSPAEARSKIERLVAAEPTSDTVADRVAAILGLAESAPAPEDTFWTMRKVFEAVARRKPLVLVLDDLHWAEPMLLDAVDHVADWTRDAPMLLLCMARPELLDDRPAWGGGKLNASSILLEPLSHAHSEVLMANLLGGAELSTETRGRIVDSAEGNPLFVEEMLSMLIDDGLLRRTNGHWEPTADIASVGVPPSIRALLTARLDRLQREERAVIERASVEGKAFHRGAVLALCDEDVRPRADGHLMALVRKELVRPDSGLFPGEDGFTFRHLLIRDAAYESLPKETRSDLHLRFADWLERTVGDRATEFDEIIGYHLESAYRYREELDAVDDEMRRVADRAARRLHTAAGRAADRGDRSATAHLLEREVRLLPDGDRRRPSLMVEVAAHLPWLGELSRAQTLLNKAIAEAQEVGDKVTEAHAVLERFRVAGMLASEGSTEASRREVERLLPIFEASDDRLGAARAWRTLGDVEWMACRFDRARAAFERATAEADAAGGAGLAMARELRREVLACAWWGSTPREEGLRLGLDMVNRAGADRGDESFGLNILGALAAIGGDFDRGRELIARSRAVDEDLGLWFPRAASHEVGAYIESLAGSDEAAERESRLGFEMLAERGDLGHASTMAIRVAKATIAQGRHHEAADWLRRGQELSVSDDVTNLGLSAGCRAAILAASGDLDGAVHEGERSVAIFEATEHPIGLADALVILGRVLVQRGQARDAAAAVIRALGLYESKGNIVSADRAREWLADIDERGG